MAIENPLIRCPFCGDRPQQNSISPIDGTNDWFTHSSSINTCALNGFSFTGEIWCRRPKYDMPESTHTVINVTDRSPAIDVVNRLLQAIETILEQ